LKNIQNLIPTVLIDSTLNALNCELPKYFQFSQRFSKKFHHSNSLKNLTLFWTIYKICLLEKKSCEIFRRSLLWLRKFFCQIYLKVNLQIDGEVASYVPQTPYQQSCCIRRTRNSGIILSFRQLLKHCSTAKTLRKSAWQKIIW
jgi:hypothetical protein